MKYKFYAAIFAAVCCVSVVTAQKSDTTRAAQKASIIEARREAIREKQEMKAGARMDFSSLTQSPYNDTDSFGKNVKFLGSLYAGTVYVYHTCDPVIFEQEMGVPLAPDDKCVAYTPNTPGATTFEFYDPAWEIEIPKDTVENVVYPLLNNSIGFDSFTTPGTFPVLFFYIPRVTIVSDALNDPAAINPATGLPMNGSYTTSLAGSRTRQFNMATNDFMSDYENYGSVAGRGLSRAYFQALGLPNTVINKLFKKKMTLKFGIRGRASGPIDFAQFFFTYRLMGQ